MHYQAQNEGAIEICEAAAHVHQMHPAIERNAKLAIARLKGQKDTEIETGDEGQCAIQ